MFIRDQFFDPTVIIFSKQWSNWAQSLSDQYVKETHTYVDIIYLFFLGA